MNTGCWTCSNDLQCEDGTLVKVCSGSRTHREAEDSSDSSATKLELSQNKPWSGNGWKFQTQLICHHPPLLLYRYPNWALPLVRFGALFFPYWAGQIGPSIAPRIGSPMALMASISGYFQTKYAFWLILGFLRLLGGSGDGTSICININSMKANLLMRYGGPGEGVKRVK